jgi:hypothetical protein
VTRNSLIVSSHFSAISGFKCIFWHFWAQSGTLGE